ncbi:hypothetical protein JRO89_XS15G0135800 [Xanthoceras sorbifolium]|uniref:Bulb-type lectin domain-containing protein n=1 Tax=Xanthoceras sorbifolium TaxID=99658 RepID=A0ABQ8H245_9ROSI|nr:hypothetical protein JRO89_XS15G0135800 [Xanthoceras sorbifolium]
MEMYPDNFLWQSFDYPGDTLLPGMKLGKNLVSGLEWSYTSWKSTDDPSQGNFTQMIDPRGSLQLFLKKGTETLYRAGSWNGLHWTGSPLLKPNPLYAYNFVSNEKEAYATLDIRERGSGCLLWSTDLIDIRDLIKGGQDLYVRVAASELVSILGTLQYCSCDSLIVGSDRLVEKASKLYIFAL